MNLIFSTRIYTEHELVMLASKVINLVKKNSIILLSGGLSAGKTTMVSNICNLFQIEIIQSPTYSIHHRYSNHKIVIDHFDLYRLETEEDLQSSGFFDLLSSEADYKFIEWPDRVKTRDYPLDKSIYKININVVDESTRDIDIFKLT